MTAGRVAGREASSSPLLARRAAIAAGAVTLVLLGWLAWGWFRDSSLVQVRHVKIAGVAGHDAPRVRRALEQAAAGMTTMHVRMGDLRRAVSPYSSVRSLSVSAKFPSTLRITVDQREAVGVVVAGQRRLVVAADGTLLPGNPTAGLPLLPGGIPNDGRLDGRPLLLARVLGAAPPSLIPKFQRAWWARDGVRVVMTDGPVLKFGGLQRLHAKWAAATRMLAARGTVGAESIDLRLPGRPTASFAAPDPAPVADTTSGATGTVPATSTAEPATTPAPQTATPPPTANAQP